jgi:hypothetical protein
MSCLYIYVGFFACMGAVDEDGMCLQIVYQCLYRTCLKWSVESGCTETLKLAVILKWGE